MPNSLSSTNTRVILLTGIFGVCLATVWPAAAEPITTSLIAESGPWSETVVEGIDPAAESFVLEVWIDPVEAEGGDLRKTDQHIDFYSWGRILVHAVTGNDEVKQGKESQALDKVELPKKVRDMTLRCVELDRRNRPTSATALLRAIANWK